MSARPRTFGLLASLYVAQGIPYGFFVQALPAMLLARGFSLPEIGLSTLLALPWAAKFLVAPFADRVQLPRAGRRRGVIVPLQLGSVAVVLGLAELDSAGEMTWLLIGVLAVNTLSALQDVVTDGLAVELLEERDRGLGNGIQVAGYRVGMILGGGALLVLLDALQWRGAFVAMAALLAVTSLPILFYRERPRPSSQHGSEKIGWARELGSWFRRPGGTLWLSVLVAYKFGDYLAQGMLRPMLLEQGLTEAQLGWILGGVGFSAGLLGALTGGLLANRFSRRGGLLVFGALQAVAVGGYAFVSFGVPVEAIVAAALFEHFTGGMATAVLFTRMMDATRPDRASTDYTVQASVVVIATGAAGALSGFTAQSFGYPAHFALSTAVALAGLLLVALAPLRIFSRNEVTSCPSPSTQAPSIR